MPFIIVAPAVTPAGATCARSVTLLDLYPTLVELAGIPAPAGLEGRSLVPLLRDPASAWKWPAVMTYLRGNHAVRSERYRYITYANGDEELYDHAQDPHEWTNIASRPDVAGIKSEHARWVPQHNARPAPDLRRKAKR